MEFAENIKYLRKTAQYTQKQLAQLFNLSANSVCEWEKGRSEPNLTTITKLAEFFEVSTDYLLGLEDDFGAKIAPPAAPMSDGYSSEEREIIAKYRNLPDKLKKLVRDQLEIYSSPGELLSKHNNKV